MDPSTPSANTEQSLVPTLVQQTQQPPEAQFMTAQWSGASLQNKNWIATFLKTSESDRDVIDRIKCAEEALETFENVSGTIQNQVLVERFVVIIFRTLSNGLCPPVFVADDPSNVFRKTLVRIMHKLLILDAARGVQERFLPDLIEVIESDNEEIGIICLKILLEIVKTARANSGVNLPAAPLFANPQLLEYLVKLLRRWVTLPEQMSRIYAMASLSISHDPDTRKVNVTPVAEQLLCSVDISRGNPDDPNANGIIILPRTTSSLRFLAETNYVIMFSNQHVRPKIVEMYPNIITDFIKLLAHKLETEELENYIGRLAEKSEPSMDSARITGAYHEFMNTYCKVFQLFAYFGRFFIPVTQENSAIVADCLYRFFRTCPKEVIWGRREVIGVIKQIVGSDWRVALLPYLPQLVELDFLVGSASGSRELLKGGALQCAMETFNALKHQLKFDVCSEIVSMCVNYCSDRSLGIPSHMIVIRSLSTHLLDSIMHAAREENRYMEGRILFLRLLAMFALRLKFMVKSSLISYRAKVKSATMQQTTLDPADLTDNTGQVLIEQRSFLRALIAGIKTFLGSMQQLVLDGDLVFQPDDLKVITRICKYSVQATELFVVGNAQHGKVLMGSGKSMEKDFTENVAETMKLLRHDVYRDVFQHIFWRFLELFKDDSLQPILSAFVNCFLPFPGFSGITTTIMLDVAMPRFNELAEAGHDMSSSVLQVLKILYGAVSLYPKEVEGYIKPLVQQIFHQGFELSTKAKDPFNLFLMFRAFFRAMGGGGHEVLYADFLPHLPMILQTLCTFHSQRQKPAYKEIFNELCLIVPVRLSTLMPHISLLAPAILSSLRGPPQAVNQALRTLELCIDNMATDYLYEQLDPVRKELMKALWVIITSGSPPTQVAAFRFIGKMCGQALKAIREPQPLQPKFADDEIGPCLVVQFTNVAEQMQMPLLRVLEEAYKTLTESTVDIHTRGAAFSVVSSYLLGILRPDANIQALESVLRHPSFKSNQKGNSYTVLQQMSADSQQYPKCSDEKNRLAAQLCLQGLLVAAATKDLREKASPLLAKFVRHFTLMAVAQQHSFVKTDTGMNRNSQVDAIDPFVLVDALVVILGHEEPAINKIGDAAVMVILEALNAVYGHLKHCVGLPFLSYLIEKMYSLFYEPSFCGKLGALNGFTPLIDVMPITWTMEMSTLLMRSLMFVLRDSFQKMTYGALDLTKNLMERIIKRILLPVERDGQKGVPETLSNEVHTLRNHAVQELIREFIQGTTSVVEEARKQAMKCLSLIATTLGKTLAEVLESHKKLISEFVPPKGTPPSLKAYPMAQQTALLEANFFFLTVTPSVVAYDLKKDEHIQIINDLLEFLQLSDKSLQENYYCFHIGHYHPQSFLPFRFAALNLLSLFHSHEQVAAQIHEVFFDILLEGSFDLHEVAVECLTRFESKVHLNVDTVTNSMNNLKEQLKDAASWTPDTTSRLMRLHTVYPTFFDEEFASVIVACLPSNVEYAIAEQRITPHVSPQLKKCANMITLLGRVTKEPQNFVKDVVELVQHAEDLLMARNARVLTSALTGFLSGSADAVIDLFFSDGRILKPKWTGFFEKLMKSKDAFPGEVKKMFMEQKLSLLTDLIQYDEDTEENWTKFSVGVRLVYLLTKKDPQWLVAREDIRAMLRSVWNKPATRSRVKSVFNMQHETWDTSVKLLVILMIHVRKCPEDVDALFELGRHNNRSVAEASRWKQLTDSMLAQKRPDVMPRWIEVIKSKSLPEDHLAEICDLIIVPIMKQHLALPVSDMVANQRLPADDSLACASPYVNAIVQTFLTEDLIFKLTDVFRVAVLKLLITIVEMGDNVFLTDSKTMQPNPVMARLCVMACSFLQKRERDHIQIDLGTITQCQNLLAQLSARAFTIPNMFYQIIMKSLFAGGGVEPRGTNRTAIDLLLPNLINKAQSPEGVKLVCLFLRKALNDDSTSMSNNNSLIFQAICRHCVPLYPHRHHFISIFIATAHKNGLSNASSQEWRRTSVDMMECLVHWEAIHKRVEFELTEPSSEVSSSRNGGPRGRRQETPTLEKGLDEIQVNNIANILMRLAFVFEPGSMEVFGRKCMRLLRFFMRQDMYPYAELRLIWLDKVLASVEQIKLSLIADQGAAPGQIQSVCLALEALTFFIPTLPRSSVLQLLQEMTLNLVKVATCYNARIAKCMSQLISVMFATWPGDPTLRNLPQHLDSLYSHLIRIIHDGLSEYLGLDREKPAIPNQTHLFCTLMFLKATIPHVPSVLDRLLGLVVNVAKRVSDEHLTLISKQQGQPSQSQDGIVSAELVVVILDILKVPQFYTSSTTHRQTILSIMLDLIGRGSDVRVYRALIRIFTDWLRLNEKDGDSASSAQRQPPKTPRKPKKKKDGDETESVDSPPAAPVEPKKKKKKTDYTGIPPPVPVDDPQSATPREISTLILKLQLQLERRFVDDFELNEMYTEMVYKIHTSDDRHLEDLKQRSLNSLMYGLRHVNPEWRLKFYQIYDRQQPKNLNDRLTSILNGINWDMCTLTNYISFCINSTMGAAIKTDSSPAFQNIKIILPITTTAQDLTGAPVSEASRTAAHHDDHLQNPGDVLDTSNLDLSSDEPRRLKELSVEAIAHRVVELNTLAKGVTTGSILDSIYQLCHARSQLASDFWVVIFPQLWKLFTPEQRDLLLIAFRAYLMTNSHQAQKDLVHTPIQAMFDAMVRCEGVHLRLHPMSVLYLGERQNLWYRSALLLEEVSMPIPLPLPGQKGASKALQAQQQLAQVSSDDMTPETIQMIHGVLWGGEESLARMYSALGEDDFSAAVWALRGTSQSKLEASIPRPMQDFRSAVGYERQGMYFAAKEHYEKAMDSFLADYQDRPVNDGGFGELQILTERYTETLKQLNHWPALYKLATSDSVNNQFLALEAAWHQDSFEHVTKHLALIDKPVPPREELGLGFVKAYHAVYKVVKEGMKVDAAAYKEEGVDRLIETLHQMCLKLWRHLPRTGTLAHKQLIEMATHVGDLRDLFSVLPALHSGIGCQVPNVGNLKTLVKNWKSRIPGIADDCRFWSEIVDMRHALLTHVINLSAEVAQVHQLNDVVQGLNAFPILAIHTMAQNCFSYAKGAKLQQLPKLAIEVLSRWVNFESAFNEDLAKKCARIHLVPVVPLVDCFERLRTHVLGSIAIFDQTGDENELYVALDALDSVNMQHFTKEMHAELLCLKAQLCSKLQRADDTYKLLSASVQIHDTCFDGWMKFGDYYETMFYGNPSDLLQAKQAIIAYSFGARSSCDATARECCAKMLALLNHEDGSGLISSAVVEIASMVPSLVMVFWIPQLVNLMLRKETSEAAFALLAHVAKSHPQPVYLHVRTAFQLMKVVDLSKETPANLSMVPATQVPAESKQQAKKKRFNPKDPAPVSAEDIKQEPDVATATPDGASMPASKFVILCANIMKTIQDSHPTICNTLESFTNQILGISMSAERFYEEIQAHLVQLLRSTYELAFQNRDRVMQATMTDSLKQFMNTIVRSFGTGVYNEGGGYMMKAYGDVASDAITRRPQTLQATQEYNKLKKDFIKDFDMNDQDNSKAQTVINKLKKWIRLFEKVIKSHPSQYYLDSHHRPLINFTILNAEIELPGDCAMQRNLHTNKVIQILPRMDVVFKHNLVCRRIYFVNNVGETIPYLIMADNANTLQGRREERVLQLFAALNPLLEEFPEACRRTLKYYVPKVTPVAPTVRLIEDSQQSTCVWDIYKRYCDKKNIEHDGPIIKFYERIVASLHRQVPTSSTVLRETLKEAQLSLVHPRVLKEYFTKIYPNADEYFLFRRSLIRSHALLCATERIMRLSKLYPDMMHVHSESGIMAVYSYAIETDEAESDRAVPFRLTPNLTEIFTPYGTQGPLQHSMIATARAFLANEPKFRAFVRTIWYDEINCFVVLKKDMSSIVTFGGPAGDKDESGASGSKPSESPELKIPTVVQKAIKRIMNDLQDAAQFSGHDSNVMRWINLAKSPDNLCRMDPNWHPWL